jgi:hypothetical protein
MNGKNYLVAIMLTALMLALMFIPMSGSQTTVQYDPWADINDDGKIDIKDIAYSSRLFGTLGDPTKNVNVTNWPTQQAEPSWIIITKQLNMSLEYKNLGSGLLYAKGYSRMFIHIMITNASFVGYHPTTIWLNQIIWITSVDPFRATSEGLSKNICNLTINSAIECPKYYSNSAPKFEVRAPMLGLQFLCESDLNSGWVTFTIDIYLRNE